MTISRRRLLATGAMGSVIAASGCLGDDESSDVDDTEADTSSDDTDGAGDDSEDGDELATGSADDDGAGSADIGADEASELGLDHGAEIAAFEYLQAIDDGDVDAVNAVVHPESPLRLDDGDIEEPGVTIDELELVTVEEAVAGEFGLEGDELTKATAEAKADLDVFLEEIGADEYAFIWGSFTSVQYGDEDGYLLVVRDGDEWLVHGE